MFDPKDPNGFNQLKAVQPEALEIRVAGICESCQRSSLLSYTLQNTQANPDPSKEYCGYYCTFCGFSAAGDRDKRGQRIQPYIRKIDDESNLPEGRTCQDCGFFGRCKWLLSRLAADEQCDWIPIRFRIAA